MDQHLYVARSSRSRCRRWASAEQLEARHLLAAEFVISNPVEVIPANENDEVIDFVTVDLDGDGLRDLIVAKRDSDELQIAPGTAQGSFGEPFTVPSLRGVVTLTVADADGDGWQDLLAGWQRDENETVLSWLRNLGNSADAWSGLAEAQEISTHRRSLQLVAEDFDQDGHVDLATSTKFFIR